MSDEGGMARTGGEQTLPGGKISETFLELAAPLLQALRTGWKPPSSEP